MGEWLDRYRVHVVAALIVVIAVGIVLFVSRRPQPSPIVISTPVPTLSPVPAPTSTLAPLRVYVTGAVRRPDVYLFAPGSIVKDALAAAGGATVDADLDRINLAVQLQDQQQVYVPRQAEGTLPAPPVLSSSSGADTRSGSVSLSLVDLNAASAAELETLPGIGPNYAQRIVDYRQTNGPFVTIEDVMEVKGIGPATLDGIRELVTVR